MQVAFKSRGRDAAAALRHSKETAASKKSASNKAAAAAAANEKEAESDKEAGGGEKEEKGPQVEEEGDTGDVSSMAPALSVLSSKMASLQQNKLLQEMLGVKVRRSSTSSSSISSVSTSSSASAHSFSGGSATSSLSGNSNDGGHNNGKTMPRHAWQPSAGAFFPWRPRSRPMSLADDSEISSLTDAQDYQQVGSLASSLGGSPVRVFRPGSGAVVAAGGKGLLGPFAAHAVGGEESEDLGATSLDPPSSGGDSVDSWQEDARGGGGSVVSGSSGGSSSYNTGSLVSDGGRSIVTESDWKEWCHMKGAVVTGGVGGKEGQGAVLTPLPSLAVEVGDGDRTTNAQ